MGKKQKKPVYSKSEFATYIRLNKNNMEIHGWVEFVLLAIMAIQPLQGITSYAYTNNEVIELFLCRAYIIRALGYFSLLNALVFYLRRIVTEGWGTLKKTFLVRPWNSFLLLLLIWSFVCVGHAQEHGVAIGGDPVRFEGILSYIAYAGFFAGACLVKKEEQKNALFVMMGVTATALGALSLWCYYHPSPVFLSYMDVNIIDGLSATFVNTNHYGYYLCTMSTALFSCAILNENKWLKIVYVLMGIFQIVVLLINNTLGSIIASVLGLCALLFVFAFRKGGKTKLITLGSLALVLAGSLLFISYSIKNPETNDLTQDVATMVEDAEGMLRGEGSDSAGSKRLGIWRADIELIKESPWIGCGTDNAYYAVEPYYGEARMPHNEYLNMAVNLGIPGGILYIAALVSLFINRILKLRRLSDNAVASGCVALTYMISAVFGVPLCTMLPFFYIFLSFFADDEDKGI